MSAQDSWMRDWSTFVKEVGDLLGGGFDAAAVTERFAGKPVVWTGRLAEKRFDVGRPGVQMDMPLVHVEMPNGQNADVDYLFLTFKDGEVESWRDIEVGATLRFATQILKASGPFPGIRWSGLDGNRGVILFLTDGAIPVP